MMKALKNKKGMTLIEVIVGIVMFAIISLAISMVLAPTLFAYMRANDFAEYNTLLDNLANQILSDLSQSTETPVFIEDDWDSDVSITQNTRVINYTVADAGDLRNTMILFRQVGNAEPSPVFSEDFYKRKNVSFKIETNETEAAVVYLLTVRLQSQSGNLEIEREYAVRPLVLNQKISVS